MAVIASQQEIIAQQQKRITELEARVQELEARLNRDSSNSSKPPSNDPPWKAPAKKPLGGRKPGGQAGHKGNQRKLVEPDETVVVKPPACGHCGEALQGDDAEPLRHQVAEIPEVRAYVTEYQLHTLRCGCGKLTVAHLPDGVPRGAFGPRLQAILAVCAGAYRLSKRNIQQLARDFFQVEISVGGISELEELTSEALAAPVEEAAAHVTSQPFANADETGWYLRSRRCWLWVMATANAAYFMIRSKRNSAVAKELLRTFAGVLGSDDFGGYNFIPKHLRQLCWAHVHRHFKSFFDYGPRERSLAGKLVGATRKLFRLWHRLRDGTFTREEFRRQIAPLRAAVPRLLNEGRFMPSSKVAGSCRWLLRHEACLWTFVDIDGIEPTNNHAERVLRPAVLWRKGCFGTNSERGSVFVERMLTVVSTLRLQKRNVLDYLAAACRASLLRQPPPALLAA